MILGPKHKLNKLDFETIDKSNVVSKKINNLRKSIRKSFKDYLAVVQLIHTVEVQFSKF